MNVFIIPILQPLFREEIKMLRNVSYSMIRCNQSTTATQSVVKGEDSTVMDVLIVMYNILLFMFGVVDSITCYVVLSGLGDCINSSRYGTPRLCSRLL